MVERERGPGTLRIDGGESVVAARVGEGERECTKRGWVEGIISPMQIAFGLRLTEYTLEAARVRPPSYFPRGEARFRVHALLKNSIFADRGSRWIAVFAVSVQRYTPFPGAETRNASGELSAWMGAFLSRRRPCD